MHFITSAVLCASAVMAFANTAPMYGSNALINGRYLADVHEVSSRMENLTQEWCSSELTRPIVIYRVKNLSEDPSRIAEASTNVRYNTPKELDLALHSLCQVHYSTSQPASFNAGEVYVVDLDDDRKYQIDELLSGDAHITVQGKPSGVKSRSWMAGVKEMVHDINEGWAKREEDDFEASFEDIEAAFKAAESMIANEEGESYVTALADDEEKASGSVDLEATTDKKHNLFTHYQFFTPGIWLSLIVSLFLMLVVKTAVGWVTSIQVTYKSFEKQIDYEKKTE